MSLVAWNQLEQIGEISEKRMYAAFPLWARKTIKFWNNKITKIKKDPTTEATILHLNQHLTKGNAVIFFDHHYAFDAVPVGLTLGKVLKSANDALIPYAVHLELGVDANGDPSLRYRYRTKVFKWIIGRLQKGNPEIQILPVARQFELNNPKMKAIISKEFPKISVNYLRTFNELFSTRKKGLIVVLSPIAGLAFPEKPILHTRLYGLMDKTQKNLGHPLQFYYVSAYPRLKTKAHYMAPMLCQHTFVARGPFQLPSSDYEKAHAIMKQEVERLRATASFQLPDYSIIKEK